MDLDIATAHVAQQHDRGGTVAVGDFGTALGVVRAELQAGPIANRCGHGDLAHDGVRDAPLCPSTLQQAVGDAFRGDVGDRGNGDVLLLAIRYVPARGLSIGEDHALHGHFHLIGETLQLALRGLGGGGDEVGAALDLELLRGGVPQVGDTHRQVRRGHLGLLGNPGGVVGAVVVKMRQAVSPPVTRSVSDTQAPIRGQARLILSYGSSTHIGDGAPTGAPHITGNP